jgi:hypothetical protein
MTVEGYLVVRTGVYRHEILGLYDTLRDARHKALTACYEETDDYHYFDVVRVNRYGETYVGKVSRVDKAYGKRAVQPPTYEEYPPSPTS